MSPISSKKQGTVYVASQRLWKDVDITADKLNNLRENAFAKKEMMKQINLLFSKEPHIEAYRKNSPDEELQITLTEMMEGVDYTYRMETAFDERMFMGIAIFNDVWEKQGREWRLTDLRHLPSYSFSRAPKNKPLKRVYSEYLQGIILDNSGNPQYYQTDFVTNEQEPIDEKYLTIIKDPADTQLAGFPVMAPLAPIFEMMAFTLNADMQYANRVGAPPLFIRLTNPKPASPANDNISDVEYCELVLQHWGKDNQYPLRESMEPIFPPASTGDTRMVEIQNALQWIIIDYFSPSSMIQKSGGTLVGGSSAPEAELLQAYISGHLRWLCGGFNQLLKKYLQYNGYGKEYSAYVVIPSMNLEDRTISLQEAELLYRSRLGHPNDVLSKLQIEAKSDKEFDVIKAAWDKIAPPPSVDVGLDTEMGFGMMEPAKESVCEVCGHTHKDKPDPLRHLRVARGHLARQPVEDKAMRNIAVALDVLGTDLRKAVNKNAQELKDHIEPI